MNPFALFQIRLVLTVGLLVPLGAGGQATQVLAGAPLVGHGSTGAASPVWAEGWEPLDQFRDRLRQDVAADGVGGITAAVVAGDRMIWAEGFGWADPDREVPAGIETIYRIGSISKPVTAIVLARLVQEGVVGLDDEVGRYLYRLRDLVDPPSGGDEISFRQLATHTSGLVREPDLEGAASGPIGRWEEQVLESIPTTGFVSPPGEEVSYSNIGFGILGLALSRAAGRPFMELVEEGIFQPLGMTRSTFFLPRELEPLLARGHLNRADGTVDVELPALEHRGRGYKVPNGGIYSTVGDLARLVAAMSGRMGDVPLSEEMRREVLRRQTPGDGPTGYGLGWSVREIEGGRTLVGHGGSVAGYTAYLLFEPESGAGVVLLRNYNRGETNLGEAARELLEELLTGPLGNRVDR